MAVKKKSKSSKKSSKAKKSVASAQSSRTQRAGVARAVSHTAHDATEQVRHTARHSGAIKHHAWRRERYGNLQEFWPFYLYEHASAANRRLHFIGSTIGLFFVSLAVAMANYWWLLVALVSGYAFAWFGHFLIEKNRPATFQYPVMSFISDWRMWYCILSGKIDDELRKYGIESR